MFKKLLSNLPFNPSLITQVAFYAKRMRQESAMRRTGLVMLLLAMLIQLFAVVTPPQYSLAASTNDIIYGGVQTSGDLIDAWQRNDHGDLQAILAYYGVGIGELTQMQDSSVDTRGGNVNTYYSIGRELAGRSDSFSVPIPGAATTIYMRSLGGWAQQVWPAFSVPSSKHGRVWILKDCGNIVTEGIPPTGTPNLSINKLATPGHNSTVRVGERINYSMVFSNKGTGPAQNFYVQDHIPDAVENIEIGESGAYEYVTGKTFTAYWDELPKPSVLGSHPSLEYQVNFWVTVRDVYPGTFCNQALVSSVEQTVHSNSVCHTIEPCPYNGSVGLGSPSCQPPPPPPPTPTPPPPDASCTVLNARYLSRTRVEFEALGTAVNGATISAFEFDTGTGKKETVPTSITTGEVSQKFTFDYPGTPAPTTYNARATAITSLGNKPADSCARKIEIQKELLPLVTVEKTTGTASQAQGSRIKVNPGEEFTYNFTVKNIGDATSNNYVLPNDTISDTLEYADLVNSGDAEVVRPPNQSAYLQWKPLTIKPGETIIKTATFKLKKDLPKTNTPPSNPKSFDCQIENTISSSSIVIDIDKSHCISKIIEKTATVLPKTGPGTSLLIGFVLTTFVGYFFARSRLYATELLIVRDEFTSSGGI